MTAQSVIDVQGLDELTENFGLRASRVRAIAQQTVNRGAGFLRTRLDERVRGVVKLQKQYVMSRIKVDLASLAGVYQTGNYESKVTANKDPVLLSYFAPQQIKFFGFNRKQKNAGISVFVSDQGGRKQIPNAFFITLKGSGLQAVATRGSDKKLRVRYGPSVDQIYHTFQPELVALMRGWLKDELTRRLAVEVVNPGAQRYASDYSLARGADPDGPEA